MPSIEKMLDFAISQHNKVTYSMSYPQRLGPHSLDCSSFVYKALIAGGFLPEGSAIGNTESLYKLGGKILGEIYSYKDIRPGDIFIRGREGHSLGIMGHTGIFLRKGEIIHCNATYDTVSINNEKTYINHFLNEKRSPIERYFRPIVGGEATRKNTKNIRGKARVLAATNVRSTPSTKAQIVASYYPGDVIYFDKIVKANGYYWLSYIGRSGKRRYTAYRNYKGNQWMDLN